MKRKRIISCLRIIVHGLFDGGGRKIWLGIIALLRIQPQETDLAARTF